MLKRYRNYQRFFFFFLATISFVAKQNDVDTRGLIPRQSTHIKSKQGLVVRLARSQGWSLILYDFLPLQLLCQGWEVMTLEKITTKTPNSHGH